MLFVGLHMERAGMIWVCCFKSMLLIPYIAMTTSISATRKTSFEILDSILLLTKEKNQENEASVDRLKFRKKLAKNRPRLLFSFLQERMFSSDENVSHHLQFGVRHVEWCVLRCLRSNPSHNLYIVLATQLSSMMNVSINPFSMSLIPLTASSLHATCLAILNWRGTGVGWLLELHRRGRGSWWSFAVDILDMVLLLLSFVFWWPVVCRRSVFGSWLGYIGSYSLSINPQLRTTGEGGGGLYAVHTFDLSQLTSSNLLVCRKVLIRYRSYYGCDELIGGSALIAVVNRRVESY